MAESRPAALALVLVAGLLTGTAFGGSGWATSPVVVVARTDYSVYGPAPGCEERILVDRNVRRALGPFGTRVDQAGDETHTPLARAIGEGLNLVGLGAVLQAHANCSEVCALIPLDASRVTSLVVYVADGAGPFRAFPIGRRFEYFYWEGNVDTTRVTDDGRFVCLAVRNWVDFDRRVFLVVGYER